MTTQELTQIVLTNKAKYPAGISCKFIKVNDEWGIKVYQDRACRDYAYRRQSKVSVCGLAPEIGVSFDVEIGRNKLYCYVTQCAKPIIESDKEYLNNSFSLIREKNEEFPTLKQEIRNLCQELFAIENINYSDDHYANFGYIDGKLVCIDFGY